MALVGLVLVGECLPFGHRTNTRTLQTKSLASAKQIALALKLYAGDHDGNFPTEEGDPAGKPVPGSQARDANAAFRNLFPTYCTAEKLFYVPGSAYCGPSAPDEVCNTRENCLKPGENNYAFVAGLSDTSDASLPLVLDGTDGTGHYVSDRKRRGGVWGGRYAIVIHVDSSGELAKPVGPANALFVPRSRDDQTHNLLDANYLDTFRARLLDPAVAATAKP